MYHHTRSQLSLGHQLSSVQQPTAALAQQRSAVRCRVLPCGVVSCRAVQYCAVLCRAVPCCAVLRALLHLLFDTMPGIMRSIIPGAGTTTPGLYVLHC